MFESSAASVNSAASVTVVDPSDCPPKKAKRGPRGGVYDPFPMKVHRMLEHTKAEGLEPVVSWLEHGRAFKIHDPKLFSDVVMSRFFNQSKYTSFQRQLNLYGFNRMSRGRDCGAYYHDLFLRGKPSLAASLLRTKVKGSGHKTMRLIEREPDFYTMPPLMDDPSKCVYIPNVFASNSPQYLPVTAVASSVSDTCFAPGRHSHSPSAVSMTSSSMGLEVATPSPSTSYERSTIPQPVSMDSPTPRSGDTTFVDELNQTIFIHELALGCSILCQLRKDDKIL